MQGVLTLAIQLWSFESLERLPSSHFGSLTLFQKWGYNNIHAMWKKEGAQPMTLALLCLI
jgi:hypothetical protein